MLHVATLSKFEVEKLIASQEILIHIATYVSSGWNALHSCQQVDLVPVHVQ